MSSLFRRIENRLRHFISPPPDVSEFYGKATDELRAMYRGSSAEIFFSNNERTAYKWLHYLNIYDRLLGPYIGSDVRMLEIGVYQGGSLGLWRKLLGEKARIFGIDIDPSCASYGGENAVVRIGSQRDPDFLRSVVDEMGGVEVVLDDGSHIGSDQLASFEALFPLLDEGGLYIIEDMQTAYWPLGYDGGLKRRGTAIEFLKEKIDEMHRHYWRKGAHSVDQMPEIESIQFFDGLAVVTKRRPLPRVHVKVPDHVSLA